jgi:hypothetical protein
MAQRPRPPNPRRPQAAEPSPTPPPGATLSPQWAFVVQLREGTPLTPEQLTGRAEHLVSGQAALFVSLAELAAFMAHALTTQGIAPTATAASTADPALSPTSRSPRQPSTRGGSHES